MRSDDERRAWREAFCYWFGDSFLAAGASGIGGMLGDLFFPLLFPLLLVPLVLGFLEGLAVGALVRAFMGRIRMYKVWLIAWLFFGFGAAVLGNWLRYRNLW